MMPKSLIFLIALKSARQMLYRRNVFFDLILSSKSGNDINFLLLINIERFKSKRKIHMNQKRNS